jgi:hypothetical protein
MDSILSFSGVQVPWAFTVSMSSGERIRIREGILDRRDDRAPSGLERVRWKPSPRSPPPAHSRGSCARARALSAFSSTSAAPPFAHDEAVRFFEKGFEALSGGSFWVDRPRAGRSG